MREWEQIGMTYPKAPGHQQTDTSIQAAEAVAPKAETLRKAVLTNLRNCGSLTVHEMASIINLPVSSIQPRFSELKRMGEIRDSGERRVNKASGKKAIVWACDEKG